MSARLIRDGILDSESVLSLPVEARWLYVTIMLSGDDVGLFEATPFRLARIADVRREHADKLLAMLVDSDLVRLYEVGGKRYGFIPKFGQRLQIKRAKHPLPPIALLAGDEDAINKIKHLGANQTVDNGCATVSHGNTPPEPEPEPEAIPSLPTVEKVAKDAAASIADCPHAEIVKLFAHHLPMARQPADWTPARQAALRTRWREKRNRQNLDWWAKFFAYVAESAFLTGKAESAGRKPFLLSLDWLLKADNFLKTIEGAYHEVTA